mmetsp:Transcript_10644/g.22770  ORF Transcript_10644/g.22770 Transcript_10644/m.22770 type:complete len:84 (-) Transcript_10644:57-308(-)
MVLAFHIVLQSGLVFDTTEEYLPKTSGTEFSGLKYSCTCGVRYARNATLLTQEFWVWILLMEIKTAFLVAVGTNIPSLVLFQL